MNIIPGEDIISTAIEKFSDGIIHKMDEAEQRRNREFAYRLKELEFYKGNYDKEIKEIFESWFGLLQNIMLSTNPNLTEATRQKYAQKVNDTVSAEKGIRLKIRTLMFCGTQSAKALALFNRISIKHAEIENKFASVYVTCLLLSVLKKDVLGQELPPLILVQSIFNDYEKNIGIIEEGVRYVNCEWRDVFGEDAPYLPD